MASGGSGGSAGESGAAGAGGEGTPGGVVGGSHASAPPGIFRLTTGGAGTGIAKAGGDGVIDLSTSECFNKPVQNLWGYPPGRYKRPFMLKGSVGNTYDLRGALFEANPQRFPVLFDDAQNTCVVGASVEGMQPRSHTWEQVKNFDSHSSNDGDGIGWENSMGKFIIEGAWIDNMEDLVGMPFDLVPDRSTTWSLRHVYARYIRDDVLENDGCLSGDIQDSFLDGIWTFSSSRPSAGARGSIRAGATVTLKDTIMRLTCMPDPRDNRATNCPPGKQIGELFKPGGADCSLRVNMENVVILHENDRGAPSWPSGTYKNVTLIWEGGSVGGTPPGVTVTKSRDEYNKARASWLQRHGCDPMGDKCSFVRHADLDKTPPANSKPYVVVSTSPSFVPLGNGGSVQWWTENVSGCTPSGFALELVGGAAGQRRMGPKQVSNWENKEQQIMYGVSCKAADGSIIKDSDRLTWFDRTSDSEKPSVPGNVKAVAAPGKITLTWDESSDNFKVATYRIYRNDVWIANVSSEPIFVDAGLDEGTEYSYQVEAFDSFANLSGKSTGAKATAQ